MRHRAFGLVWRGLVVALIGLAPAMAAEHGGHEAASKEHGGQEATQEHGGKEHAGTTSTETAPTETAETAPKAEPTADQIRGTIRKYIEEIARDEGAFYVDDEVTGEARELTLIGVHERVGKTGDYYYSCTDMRDVKTGEALDLDFDVEAYGEDLEVVDVRIHKVEGKERYTYDASDNRIPVE